LRKSCFSYPWRCAPPAAYETGAAFVAVIASEAKQSSRAATEGAPFAYAGLDCFASLAMTMDAVSFIPVVHGAAHETGAKGG
jgi:hypothetical protein